LILKQYNDRDHRDIDLKAEQLQEVLEGTDDTPLVLTIEDSLDLHTFQPGEVQGLLDDYLEAVSAKGFREVSIIHGKGQGILRRRVRGILGAHPKVAGFRDAEPGRGGWGATVVDVTPIGPADASPTHEPSAPIADGQPPTTINDLSASADGPVGLHQLSGLHLLIALALGMSIGALLHQVLVNLGADPVPAFIFVYGLGAGYFLIRKAAGLLQVTRRAAWAALALGALWLALHLIR
jgi:hypothetical protein